MAQIDIFANQLLEEAKRFLEKASESPDDEGKAAHLHASLLLLFCALEAHVNAIGEEFSRQSDLSANEKGILLEKDVKLERGEFKLTERLKMSSLEDRIEFLYARFSGKSLDRSATSWRGRLSAAINLRNRLTHVRDVPAISEADVKRAIEAIIASLEVLFQALYKSKFPPAGRGTRSRMTF